MSRHEDAPRPDGGARREPAAEALERRYRRLLAWYPKAYRAANADDMLGVALARSADGRRWPEPGEAVNLIVSGAGERLAGLLRQQDQRDTAAVLAVAGPLLLAAGAVRTMATPFLFTPAIPIFAVTGQSLAAALAFAVWWTLVALAGMLCWRRIAATGACLGLAGQVVVLALPVPGFGIPLMVAYWQVAVALIVAVSALVCWGFQGFLPSGPPAGLLVLSPLHWEALMLVPVVGVVAGFTGLRLYERRLRGEGDRDG
jgi:hypothetical protein